VSRTNLFVAALSVALAWPMTAAAGPMLTGSVTYDRSSQLYTYSYALDDRPSPGPVDVVELRVATHVYDIFNLNPVGHTAPAPFTDFYTAEGGWNTAAFPGGTFYEWHAWARPGATGVYTGFSFTSRYGPAESGPDNYALFSSAVTGPPQYRPDGFVEYGRMVAPDLAAAPEPGTLALAAVGLASAAVVARRRRREGRSAGL
jgi:hypothetical protein